MLPNIPHETIAIAHQLADTARDTLRAMFRQKLNVERKGDDSLVSEADRLVEEKLRAILAEHLPDHAILGEEHGERNTDSDWLWVIDPIDGTQAFLTGKPSFTTLIGLCHFGVPVLGIADQPILGERWLGIIGQGTTLNGATCQTRMCEKLSDAMLSTTSPYLFTDTGSRAFQSVRAESRDCSYGSDGYAYALLSSGFIDLVVEEGLKPYDLLPLQPIVAGAGGVLTHWDGSSISREAFDGTALAAATPALHSQAKKLLQAT